jgi:hypothetical protein
MDVKQVFFAGSGGLYWIIFRMMEEMKYAG